MRLTVKLLQVKAKKLKMTLVVSSGAYKYTLYYGSGKKKVIAHIANTIQPLFDYLERIEKARHENNA